MGKPPHTDDHDVVVLQLWGSKLWHLLDDAGGQEEVHLRAGDVLYLPQGDLGRDGRGINGKSHRNHGKPLKNSCKNHVKTVVSGHLKASFRLKSSKSAGIPHHAAALEEPSLHLAVGLQRAPMACAAILGALATRLDATTADQLPASLVEEMEMRRQAYGAHGGRRHWLNQLLPMHLQLLQVHSVEAVSSGLRKALAQLLRQRLGGPAGAHPHARRAGPGPAPGRRPAPCHAAGGRGRGPGAPGGPPRALPGGL